ncbi:MAG: TrbG/VirB9 family P-type conjugative transfer protein [Treponema sp.]|jgi:type IV secretion system protein VirB9|nr:TrbG/VirB9 family P-type conjugative transfer protein [Treponema sp.]
MKSLFILFCLFAVSCASFDVDNNLNDSVAGGLNKSDQTTNSEPILVFPDPEIVFIDRPVFVPPEEPQPKKPAAGKQAVQDSNNKGIIKPHDYSHAAIVYVYNPDEVYEVFAQPLRVCDLVMEPNERVTEIPYVSDSERWFLGAGVSYDNGTPIQHVYVKPESSGLSASLIINTDRRVYRIILRSYTDVHMPLVRWRYNHGMPNNYISPPKKQNAGELIDNPQDVSYSGIDPRFLSFNYRVKYGFFNKPVWLPTLVFDDGSKTFIQFPDLVLQRELPAVFENRKDIINYRVTGNLIIIDKLIEEITVKIARTEVTVVKKRGKNGR